METLRQDLRLAVRLLWKHRAFTVTTILTLALCIGANTAIFTVVRSVLLRPLPYADSHRLVFLFDAFPGAGVERAGTSVPNYFDRRPLQEVFDSVALYQFGGYRAGQGASAEGVEALNVTPSFFTVLRTSALRGRLFTEEEGTPGKNRVAVVSATFARRQPGGIDGIVGRELRLNDTMHTVVGVLPDDFTFLSPTVSMWVPLAFTDQERSEDARHSQNHEMIGRLADGASAAQAQSRIDAMNAQVIERSGPIKSALINAGYHTRVLSFEDDLVRNVRGALRLLWFGVLFVLLIAAVNITNLSLARASGRIKELGTRRALGAGWTRVARQLVTEATLLTLVGGTIGLVAGSWSLEALEWLGLAEIPRAHEIRMDATVVLFTFGVALVLGVVVGLVPALQLAGMNLNVVLREDSRTGTAGRSAKYLRRGLVVSQVALAFVLLIGAGLLFASFRELLRIDPGFRAEHVLTGRVSPLPSAYPNNDALRSYVDRALERIRQLPGVAAAGVSSYLPFSWDNNSSVIIPEGYTPRPGESVLSPNRLQVTHGYLDALRVPLKRGRLFNEQDTATSTGVVIVDEALAARFWPNADPIGRRMYLPSRVEDVVAPGPNVRWFEVVGVVASVKLRGLVEGEDARSGAYYLAYSQNVSRNIGFAIRTADGTDAAAITATLQRTLAAIDPELQLYDTIALPTRVERSLNPRRGPMLLSLGFAGIALLLAAIGIYGVLTYQVSQRTREIGIRMALGSGRASILALILREGAALVVIGLLIGTAGAIMLRGLIVSQLYGVQVLDLRVIVAVVVLLVVAALIACLGPARRAARVDPVVALQG